MKGCFFAVLLLFSTNIFAQFQLAEKFQKISTVQQAEDFIAANPRLKPALIQVSAEKDTSRFHKRLLRQKKGDVFSVGYVTYKVLEATDTTDFRASYIFLDGFTYDMRQIDSLKKLIVQKISAGESFEALSDQYTMDGNKTRGDTEWSSGQYSFPPEFEQAVLSRNKGDVFFVDMPDKQWYYIVKKTYDNRLKKNMLILRSIGR